MTEQELKKIHKRIIAEIEYSLTKLSQALPGYLSDDIQPPTTIIRLAAIAAATVFMAFERGHQMTE
jgi:hypothetical protein